MKKRNKKKVYGEIYTRATPDDVMRRNFTIEQRAEGGPASFDPDKRTVKTVVTSDQPVRVFDPVSGRIITEILLQSGRKDSPDGRVPMLDNHDRFSVEQILGSALDFKGKKSTTDATLSFASGQRAEDAMQKVAEGHIRSVSAGYQVFKRVDIPDGKTREIKGQTFRGPVSVATSWQIREVSLTPIPADDKANIRSQTTNTEDKKMDPKIRELLIKLGMRADMTDEEAEGYMAGLGLHSDATETMLEAFIEARAAQTDPPVDPPADPPADPPKDGDTLTRAEMEMELQKREVLERTRVSDITIIGRSHEMDQSIIDKAVGEGTNVDSFRALVLEIVKSRSPKIAHRGVVEFGVEGIEKLREVAGDALMIKGGFEVEKPAPGVEDFQSRSLLDIGRMFLLEAGESVKGNKLVLAKRAMSTSDFPLALSNLANKSLMTAFEQTSETWAQVFDTGNLTDFKTASIIRMSEFSDLIEVAELAEFTLGTRTEQREQVTLHTEGRLFGLSRQAMINDDLSALTDEGTRMGEAAARAVGDTAWGALTANAEMGDSVALFSSASGTANLATTVGAPGVATVGAGVLAMGTHTDLQGLKRLNITPEFFMAPKALETESEVFFNTITFTDSETVATDASLAGTRKNIFAGRYTRVYEPRLDEDSTTRWYLGGPKGKTIRVYFLNGQQAPFFDSEAEFIRDALMWKVRIDVAAIPLTHEALYANNGV